MKLRKWILIGVLLILTINLAECVDTKAVLLTAQKWTNIADAVLETAEKIFKSKMIKSLGSAVAPIGIAVSLILPFFEDEPDIEALLEEQTKLINESFHTTWNQIAKLSIEVKKSETKQSKNIAYESIKKSMIDIDIVIRNFPKIIKAHESNKSGLAHVIDKSISDFLQAHPDDSLTQLFVHQSFDFIESDHIVDLVVKSYDLDDHHNTKKATTTQIINELYKFIMVYVAQGAVYLRNCYKIKELINGDDHANDIELVEKRYADNIDELSRSMKVVMGRYTAQKYSQSYLNLLKNYFQVGDNFVKLQRVEYLAFLEESALSKRDTCRTTCSDYTSISWFEKPCEGTLRDCDNIPNGEVSFAYSTDQSRSLVFYQYLDWPWYGPNLGEKISKKTLQNYQYFLGPTCEICCCECDAHNDPLSHRSFYTGVMEPEKEGYVIVGVRFAKQEGIIFLQIKVGQLMAFGMINPTSVYWQKLPGFIDYRNVFKMEHDKKSFYLNDLKFGKDIVLTGIQLIPHLSYKDGVTTRIYGNRFDFNSMNLIKEKTILDSLSESRTLYKAEEKVFLNSSDTIIIQSKANTEIVFTISDSKTDAGQSFLPFFDSQDIDFDLPAPLSGLQMIHYYTKGFGGFIRPRIYSINYVDYE